jgi:hypothetical protein
MVHRLWVVESSSGTSQERLLPSSGDPTDSFKQWLPHLWHHYGARHLRGEDHP